jgi:glutamine amidotransferase
MKKTNVSIIDYGVGNLLSVSRAFDKLNATVKLTRNPDEIISSDYLVFPGVGAFNKGMDKLNELELVEPILSYCKKGRPFLGICLGMQLMMSKSYEFGETKGLDIISGEVVKIPETTIDGYSHKIPHIGWNRVSSSDQKLNQVLNEDLNNKPFYFVHSFMSKPLNNEEVLARCIYNGREITAMIGKENLLGCQFHPEKSGEEGLELLKNFLSI